MSTGTTGDPDDRLRQRLKSKLEQKADNGDGATKSEAEYSDDDEMDDEDDMDMNMDGEAVNEAAQMIAEAMDDVTPDDVMDMLEPLMGEDTRDDDTEMAGNTEPAEDVVTEEDLSERLDSKLSGVVTEDELDAKLDEVVDALADETRDVLQKADVGGTPTPSASGSSSVTTADLFSDTTAEDSA